MIASASDIDLSARIVEIGEELFMGTVNLATIDKVDLPRVSNILAVVDVSI